MARKKTVKKGSALALEKLKEKIGESDATDAQKKEMSALSLAAKSEKFVEIANKRVPRTMKAIKLLGNLSGSAYKCTEAQAEAICDALSKQVQIVKQQLTGKASAEPEFKL